MNTDESREPTDVRERKPWDRMEGEPHAAYRAFEIYRKLGPGVRSQVGVAREIRWLREKRKRMNTRGLPLTDQEFEAIKSEIGRKKTGIFSEDWIVSERYVPTLIRQWSSRYAWVDRARAYDEHLYEQVRMAEIEARKADAVKAVASQRRFRESFEKLAFLLISRIRCMLESNQPLGAKEIRELTLAAERAGLVKENAFKGVRDILDESSDGGDRIDSATAAKLEEFMVAQAGEGGNFTVTTAGGG
jgi:hypothetical protein